MLARGPVLRRVAHQSGLRGHGLGDQAKAGRARYERARMADTPCWWAIPAGTRAARQRSRDCPSQRRRLDRTGDSAEREQRCQRFGYRTRRPIKRSGTSPRRPSCLEPSSRNGRALVPPYAASQRSRPIGNSRAPRPRRRAIAESRLAPVCSRAGSPSWSGSGAAWLRLRHRSWQAWMGWRSALRSGLRPRK